MSDDEQVGTFQRPTKVEVQPDRILIELCDGRDFAVTTEELLNVEDVEQRRHLVLGYAQLVAMQAMAESQAALAAAITGLVRQFGEARAGDPQAQAMGIVQMVLQAMKQEGIQVPTVPNGG